MNRNVYKLIILILILLIVVSFSSWSQHKTGKIVSTKLYQHLISRGDKRPDFNPYRGNIDYFLYAIHKSFFEKAFVEKVRWTKEKNQQKLNC